MRDDLVTVEDLPKINRVLHLGDQVILVSVKGGVKAYRNKREEIDLANRPKPNK